MPANLTPDFLNAEQDFKSARTHREKVEALERMLATVPKHDSSEESVGEFRLGQLAK